MKTLAFLAVEILTFSPLCWGLVGPATVWEFRAEATAGNLNGCAYDPSIAGGVDYSQQEAANLVITDLIISAGNNSIVSSVLTPFVAGQHEGNVLHVTAGTGFNITGPNSWHTILSIDGLGNATLMDSAGTVGSTGGTARVGGAGSLNSTLDDDVFDSFRDSNTVWVKNGSYTLGEPVSVTTDAFLNSNVEIMGYNTIRGDNPHNSTAPVIAGGANAHILQGDYFNFKNLSFTGTGTSVLTAGTGAKIINVKILNTSVVASRNALATTGNTKVFKGDFSSLSGNGILISAGSTNLLIRGNYIHHSSVCLNLNGGDSVTIEKNLIETCQSSGVAFGLSGVFNNLTDNTIFSTRTPSRQTGIDMTGASTINSFIGNIIYGASTGIAAVNGSDSNFFTYNNFFNNTVNFTTTTKMGDNTTFLDPQFADWVHSDFTIGGNLKGLGYPGAFGSTNTTGYLDLGAVQRQEPSQTGREPSAILRNAIIRDGIFK